MGWDKRIRAAKINEPHHINMRKTCKTIDPKSKLFKELSVKYTPPKEKKKDLMAQYKGLVMNDQIK